MAQAKGQIGTQNKDINIPFDVLLDKGKEILKDMGKEDSKLNILIIGKTGIGKSTLINAIFGKQMAQTGDGAPVTQEIREHKSGALSIYDTKGLEIKDHSIISDLERFIDSKDGEDVDSQIHIAWLCIAESGRRIEDIEIEIFNMLKNKKFPTIVVITKAERDKGEGGEKFSDIVKQKFGVDDKHLQRVRAIEVEDDDGEIKPIKREWIEDLIKKSKDLLPQAQQGCLIRKQTFDKKQKRMACKQDSQSLVSKYATAASAVCVTPIPFSDMALILPTQVAMIGHISKTYDMELNADTIKTIATTLVGVCATGFAVRFGVSLIGNALKFIPGGGTLAGTAINGGAAFGTTKAMGELYIKYLDSEFDNIYRGKIPDFKNMEKFK